MIFHALQQKANVVVCSKDADVFHLIVFVCALNKTYEKQVMKIQSNKFINTWRIVEFLGNDVATKFPKIHAAPNRDTTSFLHLVGKIKVSQWKKKASKHNQRFMQSFRHHS